MRRHAIVVLLVAGCPGPERLPVTPPTPPSAPAPLADSPPAPRLPAPTAEQSAAFASGVNRFGFDLYRRLRSRPGNLVFSPASTSMALAMTWGGARGETAREMAEVLHFGDAEALHDGASRTLSDWNDPGRSVYTLRVVNRLFGARGQRFEAPFLALTRDRYGALLEPLDFAGDAEGSRLRINGWVAGETEQRIRDLLPPESIQPDTRLVLTNAIYFLGEWDIPFTREATRPATFHLAGGATAEVPMMNQGSHYRYAEDEAVQAVEMTYRGGAVAMLLVVPRAVDGLAAVEQGLDAGRLDRWVAALTHQRVNLAMPKVTIDPPEPLSLAAELSALGMRQAFDRDAADFSGMSVPPTPEERLFISEVFHKAFVRIDEEGTEAAAATAVVMAPAGAAPRPEQPKIVRADRPFLFFIRDVRSGAILFAGRVTDPR
jgi:serpin B